MRPWTWMAAAAGLALGTPALAAPPAWVDGRDSRYSRDKFVIGVGKGPNRNSADLDARAEIARVFESKIKAVATDFQAAASKVNSAGKGVSVEVQELARFTEVTSKKTLSGTELRERATDGGTHYTLAPCRRRRAATS
jgi:phosphatidate phosphatase APP1